MDGKPTLKRRTALWIDLKPLCGALMMIALVACERMSATASAPTLGPLVGTWKARRDGELAYLARLADDESYTLTAPGDSEPYQRGRWLHDREAETLTLGAMTLPVSWNGPDADDTAEELAFTGNEVCCFLDITKKRQACSSFQRYGR